MEVLVSMNKYDVIVVGGGHAGLEAAFACAHLNKKTLLLTLNIKKMGNMPCNPSIGGSAKGIIVREIDALGGEMGINADKSLIQMKMLNSSKGPSVHSLRAQADRKKYQMEMKHTLEKQNNLASSDGASDAGGRAQHDAHRPCALFFPVKNPRFL